MFTIENQGANSYLVYKLNEEEQLDTLSLGMLSNNKITGFASVLYTQLDEDKFLKYTITSRVPLKQVFSSVISRDRLLTVLIGIVDAIIVSDDYMLTPGSIVLDINNIYVDVSTYSVALICLPIMDKDISDKDVKKFFKQLLFDIQVEQNENTDYFSKIINYLNMGNELSLADFRLLLLSFKSDAPVAMGMSGMLNVAGQQAATSEKQQKPDEQNLGQQDITPQNNISWNATVSDKQEKASQQVPESTKTINIPKSSGSAQLKNIQIPGVKTENSESGINIPGMSGETNEEKPEKKGLFAFLMHKEKKNDVEKSKPKKMEKEKKHKEKKVKGVDVAIPGMGTTVPQQQQETYTPTKQEPVEGNAGTFRTMPLQSMGGAAKNFGETTVLSSSAGAGETTVLSDLAFNNNMPFLIRMRNNERIYVDKPVFRIGKERNYVDYFISDNTAVSRSHADIISKNGSYYVEDMNSTNHTYVNGSVIHSGVQVPINNGDKLMFANEEYEFRVN